MRIAIVHDSITQLGGAERVLEALHELYPEAPVFTLVFDRKLAGHFEGWTIVSSPLQYLYRLIPKFQLMLPFIPFALKFFDFKNFDLVISSSSVFAKNISVPKGVVQHINYCHTPARFLWTETDSYIRQEVPYILRWPVKMFLNWMRKWDYRKAQDVTHFIANSKNVQERIEKYYNRDSTVIYPCIDNEKFYPTVPKENFYLLTSRLQAHKRVDLVVQAFNELGYPLHVIGTGRDEQRLKAMAKDNIDFLGRVDDRILRDEYSAAKAFIFPQEEDFGLTPLEANACGTPVIAYKKGGALETIEENINGLFFEHQTVESLIDAVKRFENAIFFSEKLFEKADQFSKENFKQSVAEYVNSVVEKS